MMIEMAPPVFSVVSNNWMSRPKGLIDNASSGVTTSGLIAVSDVLMFSPSRFVLLNG